MRQNRHSLLAFPKFDKCLFGIKGKSTAGVILPLEESSWLNWSSDKDNTLGLVCKFFVISPKILNIKAKPTTKT